MCGANRVACATLLINLCKERVHCEEKSKTEGVFFSVYVRERVYYSL